MAAAHEARVGEIGEMKRKRGRRQLQLFADRTGGHALRARFHEQPEDAQPRLVGQRCEGSYGLRRFHDSRIMEMMRERQARG